MRKGDEHMSIPYTPPAFLQGQSADEIHRRMMANMPSDIDKSELSIPWDFTRPSAIEKAELIEFSLNETIKIMFPHWAYDEWLDLHGYLQGISRRPANRAYAELTVTARAGTVIPRGFQFATPSNLTASVLFEALEEITFTGEGLLTMTVPVQAIEGGVIGNVPPDSVILMVRPDSNISFVGNNEAATGGFPEESDDDYRKRILDAIRFGISFTGRDSDYVRWAREVAGVGSVVVDPEWDDPSLPDNFSFIEGGNRRKAGAVRLFIIDSNGIPANQQILDAVFSHIIRPDNRMERLAPIGARLTVQAPAPIFINVSANIVLCEGENLQIVIERFKRNLDEYWLFAATQHDLRDVQSGTAQNLAKYVMIGAVLAKTAGIINYDYSTFKVNSSTSDIPIGIGEFPVTMEVDLYV
jgi:uncharacterized phage protein gp47/JayE